MDWIVGREVISFLGDSNELMDFIQVEFFGKLLGTRLGNFAYFLGGLTFFMENCDNLRWYESLGYDFFSFLW